MNFSEITATNALEICDLIVYKNMYILLIMFTTLSLSTYRLKSSFSILKSYLRSTMTEQRLYELALLYIHHNIAISSDEILSKLIKKQLCVIL